MQEKTTSTQTPVGGAVPRGHNEKVQEDLRKGKTQVKKSSFITHLLEKTRRKELNIWKQGPGGLVDEYRSFRTGKQDYLEKYDAYETVVEGATDTLDYYLLLIFSCLIAVFGLMQNSPAVIIGAMIVAPLMGPIFGLSAGVLWGSLTVIREAVTTLLKGVILVLILAGGLAWLLPGTVVTQEIINRGHPGLLDIFVAVACGFIGAFSYVNKRISSVVSGVAISVALMPPLCTVGIGLGLAEWDIARGAAILFGVNLAGIILAASIVFYLVRLHPRSYEKGDKLKAALRAGVQILLSLSLIVLVSLPLAVWARRGAAERKSKEIIINQVKHLLPECRIYSMDIFYDQTNRLEMVLLNQGPSRITNRDTLQERLAEATGNRLDLRLYILESLP